jgi:hypothetical protein
MIMICALIFIPVGCVVAFFLLRGHRRASRIFLWLWAFLCVAGLFSPMIWTVSWHIWRGNQVLFEGYQIHVPSGWLVTEIQTQGKLERGLELEKLRSNILSALIASGFPASSISLTPGAFPTNANPEETIKSWESFYWTMPPHGFGDASQLVKVESASQRVVCMKTQSRSAPNKASASCLFPITGWTASFWGEEKDFDTFLDVIRTAKQAR